MEDVQTFVMPHASRNAERIGLDMIKSAVAVLVANGVNGLIVKQFGETGFDIVNPDPLFSHLEFRIYCVGWERELEKESPNE